MAARGACRAAGALKHQQALGSTNRHAVKPTIGRHRGWRWIFARTANPIVCGYHANTALSGLFLLWGMGGGGMDRLRGNQDRLLVCTDGPKAYLWKSINALFFSSYLNLLMLCTPFAVLARQHGSDGVIFAFSLLAIAPFAERLSFVTEQLALHTNETRHSRGTRGCAPQLSHPQTASWVWHGWLGPALRAL